MTIFADGLPEYFEGLPDSVKREAARKIELLSRHPRMYPVRSRGLMHGYRYFVVGRFLFYYSVGGNDVRLTAILPGVMRFA